MLMKIITLPSKFIFFLIILICFSSSDILAEKRVTVKGVSFFEPGRELVAREKALDQAKRAAVEKAIGTFIESETTVENYQILKDQILTRSSGYLKHFQIVKEKKTDLGTYEIVIQADVEFSALVNDFDRFKKILSWQKNPHFSIIIEPGMDQRFRPTALKTVSLLTEKLTSSGLKVFKYTENSKMRIGFLVGLSVDLSTTQTDYQNVKITLNEISLNANIYQPGNDEILATSSAVKSIPGENRLKIIDKGARLGVESIWKDLRKQLIKLWEKELYDERDITVVMNNLSSLSKAKDISSIFESDISGMVSARLIHFTNNRAEYSLKYRGWPEHFLNEIQMSYFKNKHFESQLKSIKGNQLIIQIK